MAMDPMTRFPTWPVSKAVDPSYITGHLVHDACGVVLALSDVIYPKYYPVCMFHKSSLQLYYQQDLLRQLW